MSIRSLFAVTLSLALAAPAFAQNVEQGTQATGSAKEPTTHQSTTMNKPGQSADKTGVQPRGTKVAPSTNSAQTEKQQ